MVWNSLLLTFKIEKVLRELLKKVNKQKEIVEPTVAEYEHSKERLLGILNDHAIDPKKIHAFSADLMDWKKQLWFWDEPRFVDLLIDWWSMIDINLIRECVIIFIKHISHRIIK